MRKFLIGLCCVGTMALSACEEGPSEREVSGGLVGAAFGALTAKALGADDDWVIIGALTGAAIGTLVARNTETGDCAYARGDGTYRIARCP